MNSKMETMQYKNHKIQNRKTAIKTLVKQKEVKIEAMKKFKNGNGKKLESKRIIKLNKKKKFNHTELCIRRVLRRSMAGKRKRRDWLCVWLFRHWIVSVRNYEWREIGLNSIALCAEDKRGFAMYFHK